MEAVRVILEADPDAVHTDEEGTLQSSLLHRACRAGCDADVLIELIKAYPDASTHSDEEGKLPLHEYVCNEGASPEVVRFLSKVHAEGAKTADDNGMLPLHHACRAGSDPDVLLQLMEENPDAATQSDKEGNRPLHYVCPDEASPEVVRSLVEANPGALYDTTPQETAAILKACCEAPRQADGGVNFPLYCACRNGGVGTELVQQLLEAHPSSVSKTDENGWLPLHHACSFEPRPETLDLLLGAHPEGAVVSDLKGDLPIHLLLQSDSEHEATDEDRTRFGQKPFFSAQAILRSISHPSHTSTTEKNEPGTVRSNRLADTERENQQHAQLEDSPTSNEKRNREQKNMHGERNGVGWWGKGQRAAMREKILALMMTDINACNAIGSWGVFLPLHIASRYNVSFNILKQLLDTYPEAAKRLHVEPGKENRLALDLLEEQRQDVSKEGWEEIFNRKSDLLFSFNPKIFRWKDEPERLRRLEQRIVDEMQGNTNKLTPVSRRVWIWMCESDHTTSVENILDKLDKDDCAALASIKTRTGQRLLVGASPDCGRIIRSRLLFVGRYHIARNERPLHQSATCLVLRAKDYGSQTTAACQVSSDLVATDESIPVVIKFMFDKDQFEREKSARVDLGLTGPGSPQHKIDRMEAFPPLVPFLDEYDVTRNENGDKRFEIDRNQLGELPEFQYRNLNAYNYALVMPEADRTLDDIYKHERPSTNQVRHVMEELARALEKLHQRGIVHGDLKLLNVVRIKGRISLIDMDASCRTELHQDYDETRDFVGAKFSSGVLPPEMIASLDKEGIDAFEKYWESEMSMDSDLWKKIKPNLNSSGSGAYVVKTFLGTIKGLPYEPVNASPKIDIWSFGALLLQLSCGEPLFSVNRDDDLISAQDFQNLQDWKTSTFEKVVTERIGDVLLRDLLRRLLLVGDDLRPDTFTDVLEHPYFKPVEDPAEAQRKLVLLKEQVDNQAAEDHVRFDRAWAEIIKERGTEEILLALSRMAERYQVTPRQPDRISSVDDLVADAEACQSDLHGAMRAIVKAAGGKYVKGPLKQRQRIEFKTHAEYNGDFTRMVDVVRGTGVFASLSQAKKIFEKLDDDDGSRLLIIRCKDRFNNPVQNGYRDVLFNVALRNSRVSPPHIAELQIHLKPLKKIKELNHRVYELQRVASWVQR